MAGHKMAKIHFADDWIVNHLETLIEKIRTEGSGDEILSSEEATEVQTQETANLATAGCAIYHLLRFCELSPEESFRALATAEELIKETSHRVT